uniref:epoxide hydrolase 1 n=1 Tax=Myxine glutinosa TaxID=7769 RepID=UPI00358EFE3C
MCLLLSLLVAVLVVVVVVRLYGRSTAQTATLPVGDGWWTQAAKAFPEDETIRPFTVTFDPNVLQDLHGRLDRTRLSEPLENSRFHYGFNTTFLKTVLHYWRHEYDWKKQVEELNKYPHFKTRIEGLDVHFVHVKPAQPTSQCHIRPLLMLHGWPGSFFEFYKILPLLTTPRQVRDNRMEAFEVICPSIPGYGFSDAPQKRGFNTANAARVFYKLMTRLGHNKFYVQGGDWGSAIGQNMAQMVPGHLYGLHLNFFHNGQGLRSWLSLLLGQYLPSLFGLTQIDVQRLFPFMPHFRTLFCETGYMHIQATKPDTAGSAVNDSPAGLAAYILEKFSTWTNPAYRDLKDGGLSEKYTLEELITNVMIYWTTNSITSSMRLYKETMGKGLNLPGKDVPVTVPTGLTVFPNELTYAPKAWVKSHFHNIVSYSYQPRGGHFAAFEEPVLLAEDVWKFVRKAEALPSFH